MIVIIRKTDLTNYSQVEKQFPSCLNGKSKNRHGVCGEEYQGRVVNPILIYPHTIFNRIDTSGAKTKFWEGATFKNKR